MNLPVEVIDAARAGRCWIVVGSHATAEAFAEAGRPWMSEAQLTRRIGTRVSTPDRAGSHAVHRARTEHPSLASASSLHAATHGNASLLAHLVTARGADGLTPTHAHAHARTLAPVTLTTTWDDLLDRAGAALESSGTGAVRSKLVHLRGRFGTNEGPVVTAADRQARPPTFEDTLGQQLRHRVLFFVGYRPEDEEFALLVEDIARACGGHLPRCHVAVAGGPMDDYLFQKWVWKGLLLFMADPTEALEALHKEIA